MTPLVFWLTRPPLPRSTDYDDFLIDIPEILCIHEHLHKYSFIYIYTYTLHRWEHMVHSTLHLACSDNILGLSYYLNAFRGVIALQRCVIFHCGIICLTSPLLVAT